ncbi:hypothetical protein JCM3775_007603 [Rhodotorula graminis]
MSATTSTNTASSAPAASGSTREGVVDGNTSAAGGSRGGAIQQNTAAQDEGKNLPNDFTLANTKADIAADDHTEPNVVPGESLSTAGPGGDVRQKEVSEHEQKGLKQRLERDDEREDREARGYDEPISRLRQPAHP